MNRLTPSIDGVPVWASRRRRGVVAGPAVGLFILLAVLASLLEVDVVVEGQGAFDAGKRAAVMEAPFSGSVSRVARTAGADVRTGDLVIQLSPDAAVDDVYDAEALLEAKTARLSVVDGLLRRLRRPGASRSFADADDVEERAVWSQGEAAAAVSDSRSADLQAARADLEAAEAKRVADEEIRRRREFLIAKGLLAASEASVVAAGRADDSARVAVARASVRRAEVALRDAAAGGVRNVQTTFLQYADESRRLSSEVAQLRHDLRVAEQYRERSRVVAPFPGTIEEIEPFYVGRYFTKSDPMFRIVPKGRLDGFRAVVLNEQVGTVQPGDPVRIRIPALPASRYGSVTGRVERVSADATVSVPAAVPGAPAHTGYIVFVSVGEVPDRIKSHLRSGMQGDIAITTRRRRVIDYVLGPVLAGLQGGLGEP